MARFFVGQRVKKVRGLEVGKTGRISRFDLRDEHCVGVITDTAGVGLFADGSPAPYAAGAEVWSRPDELEPITDPGREVVSWSECLWRPEHLRVSEKECQR